MIENPIVKKAYIAFTDIQVKEDGRWYSKNILIQNLRILSYFKKNLHRDQKGIFIFNTFKELSEKGYMVIRGPVLKVTDIEKNLFLLETGETIHKNKAKLVLSQKMTLLLKIPRLRAWAFFSKELSDSLAEMIEISGEKYFWNRKEIKVVPKIKWS